MVANGLFPASLFVNVPGTQHWVVSSSWEACTAEGPGALQDYFS